MVSRYYSKEIIKDWLVGNIAAMIKKNKNEINISAPLADYGLDSIHAVGLSGDIEQKFNIHVDPTIAWDYPTILQMSEYLYSKTLQQEVHTICVHQAVS